MTFKDYLLTIRWNMIVIFIKIRLKYDKSNLDYPVLEDNNNIVTNYRLRLRITKENTQTKVKTIQ